MSTTSGSSLVERPLREVRDQMIERGAPAQGAGGDLGGERAVALVGQVSRPRGEGGAADRRAATTAAGS